MGNCNYHELKRTGNSNYHRPIFMGNLNYHRPEKVGNCNYHRHPIEHKLFSHISINWSGQPLRSFETAVNLIKGTKTRTGLKVKAKLIYKEYQKGESVTDEEMAQLNIEYHEICEIWNYTIRPGMLK